ncbi:MAG: hypothetical protein ACJ76F_12545, partial [Bacteroidia bacterium]
EYEVAFNEKSWEELEKSLSEVKVQSSISLGSISFQKIKPAFVIIPVLIAISSFVLYLSVDKMSGNTAESASALPVQPSIPEKINSTAQEKTATAVPEEPTQESIQKTNEAASVQQARAISPPVNPENSKVAQSAPALTAITSTAPGKVGAANDQGIKKKRGMRKNGAYDAIETIRTSSLIPSSDDDDVVVPSN